MTTLRLPQVQARVTVTEEQTVLEAALDAGVQFPHSCRSGRCGACKSRLLSGKVMMREHSPFALDVAERDSGYILACRAVPLTDVAVAWSNEQVVAGAQARIVALHTIAPEIYRLVLRPEEAIAFSPGQFFEIELAPGITRSYSVASEQGALHLEFHIRAIAGGRASGILASERELGDVVRVSGPFGSAIGAGGVAGPILAIAASTGHAPVQSILNSNDGRRVHLVSFARQHDGFYLNGLFTRAAEADSRFTYQAITTGAVAPNSSASPLAEAISQLDCDLLSGQVYIAGPPGFVDAAAALVTARRCLTGVILTDRFELSAAAATG
ncbi:MAG: 2Fe-2S iron-sulfur cluster-binding protein [Devosia indica]|uniref:2Fe-2S iron-sulfur cluster-binding protein n=1 Tax=Devosia polycyclovorans TaxID=3345148 RepID=UPI0035D112CD